MTATIRDSSNTIIGQAHWFGATPGGYAPAVNVMAVKRFDVLTSTQWVRVVIDFREAGSTNSLDVLSYASFYKL